MNLADIKEAIKEVASKEPDLVFRQTDKISRYYDKDGPCCIVGKAFDVLGFDADIVANNDKYVNFNYRKFAFLSRTLKFEGSEKDRNYIGYVQDLQDSTDFSYSEIIEMANEYDAQMKG